MHVVLVAFGSLGDVRPSVALGQGLRRAGHDVLLCGRPEIAGWLDLGLELFPVPAPPPRRTTGRRVPWFVALRRYARDEARPQFAALRAAARGADLLLSTGPQLVVAAVGEALGVRYRSILLCPQMLPSRRHPPLAVPWAGAPPLLQRAGRRFHVEVYNRTVRGPVAACRRGAGLGPLADQFTANFCHHPIVACDSELAPIPADCPLPADQVGYLHLEETKGATAGLPEPLERFLAAGSPPVYLGLGSTAPAPPAALTRLIVEAVGAVGCRAVVSRGWVGLGEGVGENAPGAAVHVTGAVPHALLFPRVAAVVHHGGAGTTAGAARAGRPQVILPPSLYDQAYWRHQVVERGLGVWAPRPQRLTASRLAGALARVLADAEIARRAAALGEVLRRRDAVADTVALLAR
jgi:vancomycin aglycone glucosyltransferase